MTYTCVTQQNYQEYSVQIEGISSESQMCSTVTKEVDYRWGIYETSEDKLMAEREQRTLSSGGWILSASVFRPCSAISPTIMSHCHDCHFLSANSVIIFYILTYIKFVCSFCIHCMIDCPHIRAKTFNEISFRWWLRRLLLIYKWPGGLMYYVRWESSPELSFKGREEAAENEKEKAAYFPSTECYLSQAFPLTILSHVSHLFLVCDTKFCSYLPTYYHKHHIYI